jgi:predicted dinucleotide-binding enzyme
MSNCYEKADIWSLSVVLATMMSNNHSVVVDANKQLMHDALMVDCSNPSATLCKDMIIKMVTASPNDRSSSDEVARCHDTRP